MCPQNFSVINSDAGEWKCELEKDHDGQLRGDGEKKTSVVMIIIPTTTAATTTTSKTTTTTEMNTRKKKSKRSKMQYGSTKDYGK